MGTHRQGLGRLLDPYNHLSYWLMANKRPSLLFFVLHECVKPSFKAIPNTSCGSVFHILHFWVLPSCGREFHILHFVGSTFSDRHLL